MRDATCLRAWSSIRISSFGGRVARPALALTAAVLLHATLSQIGWLTFVEIAPFVLISLPSGVRLDRVRKPPVYIGGESLLAAVVAFVIGTVYTVAGSAAQMARTQVVARDRLVKAHTPASSGAEAAGQVWLVR